jgi:hypothetical protein
MPGLATESGCAAYITPKVRWVGQEFQDVKLSSL